MTLTTAVRFPVGHSLRRSKNQRNSMKFQTFIAAQIKLNVFERKGANRLAPPPTRIIVKVQPHPTTTFLDICLQRNIFLI